MAGPLSRASPSGPRSPSAGRYRPASSTDRRSTPSHRPGGDVLLNGTPAAQAHPYLTAGDLSRFLTAASAGYYLVGFWGHGVNSYAFYYAEAEAAGSVWLRLPFGGVYNDNEDTAPAIPDCLDFLLDFLDAVRARDLTYMIVQSFARGEARLDAADGRSWRADGTFLYYPMFRQQFAEALEGSARSEDDGKRTA